MRSKTNGNKSQGGNMKPGGRKPRTSNSSAPEKQGASKPPRITTSPTTADVVDGLKEVADRNQHSVGREALIAVQSYVFSENTKRKP